MNLFANKEKDISLLLMRVSLGLMMIINHGWAKLVNFSSLATSFPDPLGIGSLLSLSATTFAEFFCSILIILGVKTRFFATPGFVTMMVAVFIVHASDPLKIREKAILYGLMYLMLMISGGGKYSVRD